MVRVMKSPNMMSTTGRSPVIAAPTASPVNPASEIGVSSTRSLPNSSNNPERTLKGVPASATSSPIMQTVESRRISSASASRIACANVSSRSSCAWALFSRIHILGHFIDSRIRCCDRKINCFLHRGLKFSWNLIQCGSIGEFLVNQPFPKIRDRIPLSLPHLLFLLRAVIFAVDVADVMSVIAISIAEQEAGAVAAARAIHQPPSAVMNGAHVLTINARSFQTERGRAHQNVPRRSLREMGVFRIEIILANIDHRKLEKLCKIHHFIQHTLTERAFPEETYCHATVSKSASRKCRACCNAGATAYNRVRSQVPRGRVCNVHGPAFALAVPRLLPQQLGEHFIRGSAFRQAMSMAAMRAGDVV